YCSQEVQRVIEAPPSYVEKKWDELKAVLLKLYDFEDEKVRYSKCNLQKFLRKSQQKSI
ncbi:hypothetical protein JAAARDRAFT_92785, partial [Jaapia argillacea MUCL 33604]